VHDDGNVSGDEDAAPGDTGTSSSAESTPTGERSTSPGLEPVQTFREVLTPPPVYAFPITDLDRLDVPVWTTAQWRADGSFASSSGYGPTDDRARVGAWGERAERAVHEVLPTLQTRRASYRELLAEDVPALDPRRLRLPVGTDYRIEDELVWVGATTYPAGETLWVPIEAAATAPADLPDAVRADPLFTPITNGMGAGESLEQALAHGLLELVQRDGNSVAYRATDRGIVLDVDTETVSDPVVREALTRFDREGLDIQVKLADSVFGIPSLYVVGSERDPETAPHPLMLTACGEAAHPDREVALRKALLEFAASRVRKRFYFGPLDTVSAVAPDDYLARLHENPPERGETRAFEAMAEWCRLDAQELYDRIEDPVFRVAERRSFGSVQSVTPGSLSEPTGLLSDVAGRFSDAEMEVAYIDFSPSDDVRVVKAIVPGMEVETMSYHRIGPRNVRRLLNWDVPGADELVGLGEAPDEAEQVPLTPADERRLGTPAWFDPTAACRTVGDLYALYREPPRHAIAFSDVESSGDSSL
jgi:ribosomal protein S12 methylthiotransferase accessory factor